MHIKTLTLQNFRTYTKSEFAFDPEITVVVGRNATGKSNLIEALFYLTTGKSFKAGREKDVVQFGTRRALGLIFE